MDLVQKKKTRLNLEKKLNPNKLSYILNLSKFYYISSTLMLFKSFKGSSYFH